MKKEAKDLKVGDICYFYTTNGKYIRHKKVKCNCFNSKYTRFIHFGFDKFKHNVNAYPNLNDTHADVRNHEGEIVFFSKEAVNEYFKK
jgi:hypothetical protein